MADQDQQVVELREEFWDLQFEASRPRSLQAVERDGKRMTAIKEALAALGTDVGPRPADLPKAMDKD